MTCEGCGAAKDRDKCRYCGRLHERKDSGFQPLNYHSINSQLPWSSGTDPKSRVEPRVVMQ